MNSGFESILAADLEKFFREKKALGCEYRRTWFRLRSFDRYVAGRYRSRGALDLKEAVRGWIQASGPRKWTAAAPDVSAVRQFCLFLRLKDPTVFVPDYASFLPARKSSFAPYIFSTNEIGRLLRTAAEHPEPFIALRMKTIFMLLYCTGIRPGEAVRLRNADLDLAGRRLFVEETKGRSRWVPFHGPLATELRAYIRKRDRTVPGKTEWVFVRKDGARLSEFSMSVMSREMMRAAGLKPARGRIGPRPYDLRHTFAVHRLVRWYRSGADLTACLPMLSTYMGHDSPVGTQTYLRATPWLLRLASRRFHDRLRKRA